MLLLVRPFIRHAMCAIFPRVGDWPGVEDTGIDDFLVRFWREAPLVMKATLALGAFLFTFSPIFTLWIPLPTFLLSKRLRDKHAVKVLVHPIYLLRQSVFVVKMACGLCWAEHPDVRRRLNLRPYAPDPGTWQAQ